jgi:hypothetical protein
MLAYYTFTSHSAKFVLVKTRRSIILENESGIVESRMAKNDRPYFK